MAQNFLKTGCSTQSYFSDHLFISIIENEARLTTALFRYRRTKKQVKEILVLINKKLQENKKDTNKQVPHRRIASIRGTSSFVTQGVPVGKRLISTDAHITLTSKITIR
jgi:hypothetical protein